MKCPKCKNSIPNKCKFCPECGADIRFAAISPKSSQPLTSRVSKPVEKKKSTDGSESHAQNRDRPQKKNRLEAVTKLVSSGLVGNSKTDSIVRGEERNEKRVQLWSGGPYWATTNIGAEEPWECGYYFWWGDTVGYKHENNKWVASNGSSSNFSFIDEYTPTLKKSPETLQSEGWIAKNYALVPKHDAAHVQWGGAWRMPTSGELYDLWRKCDWAKATMHGANGYVIHGRDNFAPSSIFLPAAGFGKGTSLCRVGLSGNYWLAVTDCEHDYSRVLQFGWGQDFGADGICWRGLGLSVRPVQGFTE